MDTKRIYNPRDHNTAPFLLTNIRVTADEVLAGWLSFTFIRRPDGSGAWKARRFTPSPKHRETI